MFYFFFLNVFFFFNMRHRCMWVTLASNSSAQIISHRFKLHIPHFVMNVKSEFMTEKYSKFIILAVSTLFLMYK